MHPLKNELNHYSKQNTDDFYKKFHIDFVLDMLELCNSLYLNIVMTSQD